MWIRRELKRGSLLGALRTANSRLLTGLGATFGMTRIRTWFRGLDLALSFPLKLEWLVIGGGCLGWRGFAKAGGVEDVGFYFAFVALGRDFFAV
jgi:hypothetical protein